MSEKESLKEFVDDNHHLITAMGVTGALAALSSRLEQGEWLAAVSLVMLVLLDWELLGRLPPIEKASSRLTVFGVCVQMLLLYAGAYVFVFHLEELVSLLPPLFTALLVLPLLFKSKRFLRFLEKLSTVRKGQVLKYIIMYAVVLFVAILVSGLIQVLLGW